MKLKISEFHVVYAETPDPRWEVQYGGRRMGYRAWDKRVATSAAKELAKGSRPSKVIVHDRKTNAVQSEILYEARPQKTTK